MSEIILQVAAKAVIANDIDQVLLVRESAKHDTNTQAGLFQLIGGRLEKGESFEGGLKREVFEEVGLKVEPIRPLQIGEWTPLIKGIKHQIIAIFMLCKLESIQEITLSEEHDDYRWVNLDNFKDIKIMEPDRSVAKSYLDNL